MADFLMIYALPCCGWLYCITELLIGIFTPVQRWEFRT